MAGETEIVYDVPRRAVQPPNGIVATGWLLGLWIVAAWVAAGAFTWACLTHPRWLSGDLVFGIAFLCGGPLFLVTWVWLANSDACRHRQFLILLVPWLAAIVGPIFASLTSETRVVPLVIAALPLFSSVAMLWIVLGVRARQAKDDKDA